MAGAPEFYHDTDQVASSDADVVHICAPNALHVPYTVQLARTGKHIICEKPLGVSLSEARGAAEAVANDGVVSTIPFAYRFHPMAREMPAPRRRSRFRAGLPHPRQLPTGLDARSVGEQLACRP